MDMLVVGICISEYCAPVSLASFGWRKNVCLRAGEHLSDDLGGGMERTRIDVLITGCRDGR